MAMTRWDPFRDLLGIQSELNRLFGRTYGGEVGDAVRSGAWSPVLDVFETKEQFIVLVELPGVAPHEVDITVEDSTLELKGERKFYSGLDEESFHRIERRFGAFSRTLTLPPSADAERIKATFGEGVLTIEIPKKEEAKPKRVSIQATA